MAHRLVLRHAGGMTWPAPSILPPPSQRPSPRPIQPSSPSSPPAPSPTESDDEHRRLSAVPAAAWVGLVGGALVLLAAAIVVVSSWDTIGRSVRFAGFVAGTTALLAIAERLRSVVPTSGGIIAHVGTFLTAGVGIAGLSLFGVTWPTCLVAGGLIAVVATEVQAQRWQRQTFRLGQIAGLCMFATGAADLTGATGGLIAAILAVGLLAVGAQRRSAALAILALLSPALSALADVGIGAGTFERAGLVGDRLGWSGPIVGVMVAMVLGVVATQRRNNGLMLTAAMAPVIGLVTGLAAVDGSTTAWLSVPALLVIAAELGWWLLPSERFRAEISTAVNGLSGTLAVVACTTPVVAATDPSNGTLVTPWAVPLALTLLAGALATMRLRAANRMLANVSLAGAASTAIAIAIAFDAPAVAVAVLAVSVVPIAAFLSRRLHPVAIYVPASWALASIIDLEPTTSTTGFAVGATLFAALMGMVLATRTRLAADQHWIGWIELSIVTAIGAATAAAFVPDHLAAGVLGLGALTAATAVLIERRTLLWAVAMIGGIGLVTADLAIDDTAMHLDDTYWVGWAIASAALIAMWWQTRSRIASSAAAATLVVSAATSMAALPVSAEQFIGLAMIAVAVLTGVVTALARRTPVDAAAIAAGAVLLATTAFEVDPAWISASWVVLGLQIVAVGALVRQPLIALGGSAVALIAAGSWWFTSGLHDWFVDAIAPAGITVGDVWAATATMMTLVAGIVVRRRFEVNSWLAYSASLAVSGLWLTSVQIERDTVWALPLALTIGLVAVALGGWHRLAAPLVGGTVLTAISVFVASGSDLRAIPTWAWLAVGGASLLTVAVLIERAGKPGSGGLKQLVERWN